VIRAYVPWYLVRNYMVFALVACLGALQLAQAHGGAEHRRVRYAVAAVLLAGAFLGYYALAPELLTPGPAGGELMFLFGGSALLAVMVTRRTSHSERSEESPPPRFFGRYAPSE